MAEVSRAEVSRAVVNRAVVSIARIGQEARRGESYTRHELQHRKSPQARDAGHAVRYLRGPCSLWVRVRVRVGVST